MLLAPTDAALGQAVVSDTRIPSVVRRGLNVESGLNDGVCIPLLLAAVAFAELEVAPTFDGEILVDLVRELGVATIIGAAVATAVALAYAATAEAGGSGFIAAFVAGLVCGRLLGSAAHRSTELTEDLGQLLGSVTFLLFGAVLVGDSMGRLDLETVAYAVLSLTVIRMLPVAISLLGTGAGRPTVSIAGWFGPRGLATVVFALTVIEESSLLGAERIVDVGSLTRDPRLHWWNKPSARTSPR